MHPFPERICVNLKVSVCTSRSIQNSQCGATASTARRLLSPISASSGFRSWWAGRLQISVLPYPKYVCPGAYEMSCLFQPSCGRGRGPFLQKQQHLRRRLCYRHALLQLPSIRRMIFMHTLVLHLEQMGSPYSVMNLNMVYRLRTFWQAPYILGRWRLSKVANPSTFVARRLKCASNVRCPYWITQRYFNRLLVFTYPWYVVMIALGAKHGEGRGNRGLLASSLWYPRTVAGFSWSWLQQLFPSFSAYVTKPRLRQ